MVVAVGGTSISVKGANMAVKIGVGEVKMNQELVLSMTEGSAAALIESRLPRNQAHHFQITHQVKAHLSLLEDLFQRKQFMLREVQGIIKRV